MIGSIGREGLTPLKLTLAGAAMTAMVASLTQGLLVSNEALLDQVLFWLAGSVAGRNLENLTAVLPYLAIGWTLALLASVKINVLSMGEDVAKGLGLNTALIKIVMGLIVILLAGGSVAVAGPIGFIGIIIPHLTRYIVGIDHRWVIPFAGLLGAILLIAADIASQIYVDATGSSRWRHDSYHWSPILYLHCQKGVQRPMKSYRNFRLFQEKISFLIDYRAMLMFFILLAVTIVVFVISTGTGEMNINPLNVLQVLLGGGTESDRLVIGSFRLPELSLLFW